MKKLLVFFSTLIFSLAWAQDLKVMSFNIRLNLESDQENAWPERKEEALAMIEYYHPEVLGVQEALPEQMKDIKNGLKSYDYEAWGVMTEKTKANIPRYSSTLKSFRL